jgi:hypothetical protein
MQIEHIPVEQLRPYARNARCHSNRQLTAHGEQGLTLAEARLLFVWAGTKRILASKKSVLRSSRHRSSAYNTCSMS